jgi:hypothetical protein
MFGISRAPASPSSSFVERVDIAFVFLWRRLRHHRHHPLLWPFLLLWIIILLHLFNERIARRG